MSTEEFSNAFDILLNSYSTQPIFGEESSRADINLNEYEKSMLLTLAQEALVKEYYNSSSGAYSFEGTEEMRRSLDSLVNQYSSTTFTTTNILSDTHIHTTTTLPKDCWYIVYEECVYGGDDVCVNGKVSEVNPTTHDVYSRVSRNPFKGPSKGRVLRLDKGDNTVELVSKFPIAEYRMRYLRKPRPIVLCKLEKEMAIDGVTTPQTSELNESVHNEILNAAVSMVINTRRPSSKK